MAYLVLARKWRPQTFDDLVGQEAITRTLRNAIALGRVHHALLFTGTRGVGKTTSARIIAKALNCETGPTATPCGECSNCKEITSGTSVDVLEIDGASNTSVDDVRELRETVRYAASKSKHKIYIIDEVHMLSNNAFNALLKTLEEPPPSVFFIFATTEVHKIPETILSRVQRFDFREISEDRILNHLKHIAQAEKIQIEDASLRIVARQAEGSMRDALSLFDQVIAFSANEELKINDQEVIAVLGLTDRALILDTLKSFLDYSNKDALSVLGKVIQMGFDLKSYLMDVLDTVREALFIKTGATSTTLPEYAKPLLALDSQELERWFDLLKRAIEDLSRAVLPKHSIELAFLKITKPPTSIPLVSLLERLEHLEKKLSLEPSSSPQKSSSNAPASGSMQGSSKPTSFTPPTKTSFAPAISETLTAPTPQPLESISAPQIKTSFSLEDLLSEMKKKKPAMAALLEQCREFKLDEQNLKLSFDEGSFYLTRAKDQLFISTVQEIVKTALDKSLSVSVHGLVVAAGAPKVASTNDTMKDREKEALGHPMVKKAMSLFQAKIEDIKLIE